MSAFQGLDRWELLFFAAPGGGAAVTGQVAANVTVQYRFGGDLAWTALTLVSTDLVELGSGYYFFRVKAAALAKVGVLAYQLTDASIVPIFKSFEVEPPPLAFQAVPGTCIVTGNVIDLGARHNRGVSVVVRPAALPAVAGPSLISSEIITTYPDALGNFSVALVQGATVLVEITPVGIRNQITVPATSSATLLSLLPPI